MKKSIGIALALLLVLCASTADAGLFGRRHGGCGSGGCGGVVQHGGGHYQQPVYYSAPAQHCATYANYQAYAPPAPPQQCFQGRCLPVMIALPQPPAQATPQSAPPPTPPPPTKTLPAPQAPSKAPG